MEDLPPAQRARRLAQLQGRLTDAEQDEDDLDEAERDHLTDEFTAALELDQLRAEIAALQELLSHARRVRDQADDSKLAALQRMSQARRVQGTERRPRQAAHLHRAPRHAETPARTSRKMGLHRDEIHGGMNPHERKRAQEDFRTAQQICVATEAAGEGINLQFCHLMINYDLPWNPTRLEQRLGRIHRIGQERDCHAFNFVAAAVRGRPGHRRGPNPHPAPGKARTDARGLADRVFDVIGEVLSLNDVNLPEMLREAAHDPRRLEEYLDQIEQVDPARLTQYEQATGIALARANVDFSGFQRANVEAEERRLMPRYVEDQFVSRAPKSA